MSGCFPVSQMKGHFIHGSGTTTVYHNRAVTAYDGRFPYIVYGDADSAMTIASKATSSFIINCAGNWDLKMEFLEPRES